ncbi:hypothetical protein QBC38DRAFT_518625, partial [Podospora fimiseda]
MKKMTPKRHFVIFFFALFNLTRAVEFIKPPGFGTKDDFSNNPIYKEYDTIDLAWTEQPKGIPCSVVLFQMKGSETYGQLEHITRKFTHHSEQVGDWIVATRKDLDISNMFSLIMFKEGIKIQLAKSHYFNISRSE